MLKLETNKLRFSFDGQEQTVKFPTIKQFAAYEQEMAGFASEPTKAVEYTLNFLCDLGLERSVADALEIDHVEQITTALRGKKK